jgi:predicted RND superfamily exporter protein
VQKFAELILKFRLPIIVITIAVTLFFGYFLGDLKIDADLRGYLDKDEPSVMLLTRVMDEFGIYTIATVALETEDVFNYGTLKRIDEVTRRLEAMDGIVSVMSLTNITDIRRTERGLEPTKIIDIDNLPQDVQGFKNLRESVLADDLLKGFMISEDGSTALITVTMKGIDLISTTRQIKEVVYDTAGDEKVYFSGGPFIILFGMELILSNLRRLIPLAIIVSVIVLYISFKSAYSVFLVLITILISTIQTLGIMGLMGIPLTFISTNMPVILIAVGSAYGIHMVSKYKEDVCSEENKIQEIKNALSRVSVPILLAGITTSIGFFSFLTAEMWVVREFGFFTGIGTMLATGISLSFLPACLSFLKIRGPAPGYQKRYSETARITRVIEKVGEYTLRNKNFLITGCVIVGIVGLLAVPHLKWEVDLIKLFEEEAPVRKTEEMMMDKFGGAIPIKLLVEGDIKEPIVLREMLALQEYLELQDNISHPLSIANLIQRAYGRMLGLYIIPETREEIDFLWTFLEGHPMFHHMVGEDVTTALIMLRLGTTDKEEATKVVEVINRYLEEELRADLIRVEIALSTPELIEVLKRERVERILSRISWEAEKKGITDIPLENVRDLIAISTTEAVKGQFDVTIREMLRIKFYEYLAEETNLSEEIIATIANDITERLLIKTPDHKELVAIIGKNAPQLYAEDPMVVEWAAEDILEIINIDGERMRISSLVTKIAPLMPDLNHEILRDKLWEINEDWAGIDSLKYADFADDIENRVILAGSQTGMHIIGLEYEKMLIRSLIESLLISVFLIFVLSTLQLKSLIGGLISLSPIFFTLLVNSVVMIIFNIPLDSFTIMAASIIVGIGIDYTIHFASRFKFELARTKSEPIALSNTWTTTGKAIAINAFSVGMGFFVLVLADIVSLQRLGYLLALSMVVASLSSMTLLPVLIVATRSRFIGPLEQIGEELILRAIEDFGRRKGIIESEIKKRMEVIESEIKKKKEIIESEIKKRLM